MTKGQLNNLFLLINIEEWQNQNSIMGIFHGYFCLNPSCIAIELWLPAAHEAGAFQ